MTTMDELRVGIDTGGTFTDFVVIRDGRIEIFKEHSTPKDPAQAILKGIDRIKEGKTSEVIHGSTVATNALLERKGARTALITTEGFEDVIIIGRQTRRELYNIFVTRPASLVPDGLRLGIKERMLYDGSVDVPIDSGALASLAEKLKSEGVESVAVSLLFSFANPSHEAAIREALRCLQIPVCLSSEILPEYREYERTSTTVINAYLAPRMSRYLRNLEAALHGPKLRVMQSNGGSVQAEAIADRPVRTIVSGPAGGVVGAFYLAENCGYSKVITFDMGGTSTDVSLCDGDIKVTHESHVDGMPIGIPMIDIHTVGAGGGSIARLDPGGALRVGPESAGADPGPICYGKGSELTVTDANVLLGRLLPRFFLGGQASLATERIQPVVRSLKWAASWSSLEALAQGVIDVVNNNMEQAIRLVSVERGYDPREFTLFCFGGAAGLHAVYLARGLGIPRVVVPPFPGALSALGLLLADARRDYSQTLLTSAAGAYGRLAQALGELHRIGDADLRLEGFKRPQIRHLDFVDARYRGQSYELTVPFSRQFVGEFHKLHERRYGYSNPGKEVEVVNVRTTFLGKTKKPEFSRKTARRRQPEAIDACRVWFNGKQVKSAVYDRELLAPGSTITGPAIIGEYSSTTVVPAGFRCTVDGYSNLVLEVQ